MAIAKTQQGLLTIVGAPRYKHRGQALVVETSGNYVDINPNPEQVRATKAGHTVPSVNWAYFHPMSLCCCDSDWRIFWSSCLRHESGQRCLHRPHSHICAHVHRRRQAGESVHLQRIGFGKCFPALLNTVKLAMQILTLVLLLPSES